MSQVSLEQLKLRAKANATASKREIIVEGDFVEGYVPLLGAVWVSCPINGQKLFDDEAGAIQAAERYKAKVIEHLALQNA